MNNVTYDDITEDLITEREQDIDAITRDVLDLNEIFKTLNTVVQEQGYLLDHIEDNVSNTVINVENAETELESAYTKQKETGKWLWWILLILIVILIVIVIMLI
jgi:syntaxin 16